MKSDLNNSSFTDEDRKDLELFQQLKPYLSHCLTINHDLNNPLAGIIGYSEFLIEDSASLSPDQLEYVKRILICAEKMEKIIGKLCEVKGRVGENLNLRELTDQYSDKNQS